MLPAKQDFRDRLPDRIETDSADQLRKILVNQINEEGPTRLNLGGLGEIVLAPAVAETLLELLRLIASGRGVQLIPVDAELTTQQAADLLNMSRPSLIKLLDAEAIPFTKTGRHRRVKAEDLFRYRDEREADRRRILAEMVEADEEFDNL